MRVNVQKRVDRILGDARKILIDTQAGNWGTRTYNDLMYPNKRLKKGSTTGTTTADSSGYIPLGLNGNPSNPNAGDGIMSEIKKLFGGGGSVPPAVQSSSANEILSGLKGEDTSEWKAGQREAFIQKVVAESGGKVTREQAIQILKISQQR